MLISYTACSEGDGMKRLTNGTLQGVGRASPLKIRPIIKMIPHGPLISLNCLRLLAKWFLSVAGLCSDLHCSKEDEDGHLDRHEHCVQTAPGDPT